MKYTPRFFYDTMPEWKRKKDSVVARYFHRPVSFVFSSVFTEIGLTPNQVSFISLIIAVLACACFLVNNRCAYLAGAILVNLWSITDSADGNMARSIGGKPYGDFIDATSSYFLVGFMLPALGFAVYQSGGYFFSSGNGIIILIGAFAGLSDTMMRLFFQKMKTNTFEIMIQDGKLAKEEKTREGKIAKIQTVVESEFGIGGWNMIAIILCALTNSFDIYVLFYACYHILMFVASTAYLIVKTGCLKK